MSKVTAIEHMEAVASAAKQFTDNTAGELAQAVAEAISELADIKADRGVSTAIIIPVDGWSMDTTEGYPYYFDVPAPGVTAEDRAEVTLAPGSLDTAAKCGLCQTCETLAGKIRLRAVAVPTADMTAQYWIEQGAQ